MEYLLFDTISCSRSGIVLIHLLNFVLPVSLDLFHIFVCVVERAEKIACD